MSIESYVRAMPKIELNVSLDGAVRIETWLLIAEQNEIHNDLKRFDDWVALLREPDYARLNELRETLNAWPRFAEDLTRMAYDAGVVLSKQNIRYAEVVVNPVLHMPSGMSLDDMMSALNDGRDRAERAWNIKMNWILSIPRHEPRRADEAVRWATSTSGRKQNIVAFSLEGREDAQPVGQFERAFQIAHKKGLNTVVRAGETLGAEGIQHAIEVLDPTRLVDSWRLMESDDLVAAVAESQTAIVMSFGRTSRHGMIGEGEVWSIRPYYDEDIQVVLSSDLPEYYKHTLSDEYLSALDATQGDALSIEELDEIALNAVEHSFLDTEAKEALTAELKATFASLKDEHLASVDE